MVVQDAAGSGVQSDLQAEIDDLCRSLLPMFLIFALCR